VNGLRIGYTCHDAFPSTDTNTQQIFWTLSEIARLGHTIDLCVPAVHGGDSARALIARHYGAPDGSIPEGLRFLASAPMSRSGGSSDPPTKAGTRERTHTLLARGQFDLMVTRRFARASHDVIWTRDPLALVSAVSRGVPAVFETYRPDFAASPAFAIWRRATLRARALAGVITHSQLAADAFVGAGVARDRVLVAHNGHAPSLMEPRLTRTEARALVGLPDDGPLVIYTGHVGPRKGTEALMALAAALPRARLVVVGVDEGSDTRGWVQACAERADARNVVLVPRVGLAEVARYMYAADCLVIPPTAAPLRRYGRTVLPMKLFSYMAAGRPILAPRLPDIEEVLVDGENAVLVRPDDPVAAACALRGVLDDAPRAERLAAAALTASRAFTWSARAQTIAGALHHWTVRST